MLIRRLIAADAQVLERIADESVDFDIADRADEEHDEAVDPASAVALLSDPSVLFWGAFDDAGDVIGMLHCQMVRKHARRPLELLLYDIGVRARARRSGVGRALVDAMTAWMNDHDVDEVWVLADNPGAVAFYAACGFGKHAPDAAVYMTRER